YGEATELRAAALDTDNGLVDMSWVLMDRNAAILHTTLDRAYVSYSKGKLEVDIGRQRINWGINLAWNPNDLFNAYNFIDFDYQERPGSDAIRVQYYTGELSSVEIAVSPRNSLEKSVAGGIYRFNKAGYDFQVLAANYFTDFAVGGGWAGNIKNAGFKGEVTHFIPKEDQVENATVAALTIDYAFRNGIYLNVSGLLNSDGATSQDAGGPVFLTNQELTARNLMPSRFTSFAQVSGAITPPLNVSASLLYLHGFDIVFVMPTVAYAISNNWETDITGQLYFGDSGDGFQNLGNAIFLRFRVSY
ncbi:MAG: hypothetical protein HKN32_08485, partial [Flavobacteriales bacterium]|nr:hypothetical protein [Flavobacteriales bacterium]